MSTFGTAAPILAAELRRRWEAGELADPALSEWVEQLLELGASAGRAEAVGHRCLTIADLLAEVQATEAEDGQRSDGGKR